MRTLGIIFAIVGTATLALVVEYVILSITQNLLYAMGGMVGIFLAGVGLTILIAELGEK